MRKKMSRKSNSTRAHGPSRSGPAPVIPKYGEHIDRDCGDKGWRQSLCSLINNPKPKPTMRQGALMGATEALAPRVLNLAAHGLGSAYSGNFRPSLRKAKADAKGLVKPALVGLAGGAMGIPNWVAEHVSSAKAPSIRRVSSGTYFRPSLPSLPSLRQAKAYVKGQIKPTLLSLAGGAIGGQFANPYVGAVASSAISHAPEIRSSWLKGRGY
jgi:hypothetical protein